MRDNLFNVEKYSVEGYFSASKFIWLNYQTASVVKEFYNQLVKEEDLISLSGIAISKRYNSKGILQSLFMHLDKGFIEINYYDYKFLKGDRQNFYRITVTHPEDYPQSKVCDYISTLVLDPGNNEYGVAILAQNSDGFKLIYQDTAKDIKDISINYPSTFRPSIKKIVDNLNEENKGLYLFSGIPGTGKTSFVNYLANTVNKQFIYVPNTMVNSLDNPAFIDFLSEHANSVLIIEDAEECLKTRGSGNTGMVSTILNITDGLLGDILKIAIIATYNADDKIIDSALLRKGRLKHKHYFDKLPVEDAKELAESLGLKIDINNPMSLGDIYNYEDESFINAPTKMGFV